MKAENRIADQIAINSVYGAQSLIDADAQSILMNNVEKAFRAFSRKKKIEKLIKLAEEK